MKRALALVALGVALLVAALIWRAASADDERTDAGSSAVACSLLHDRGTPAYDACIADVDDGGPPAGRVALFAIGGVLVGAGVVLLIVRRRPSSSA